MRKLIAILSVLLLTLALAPIVNAGTQGGCASKGSGSVQVWENLSWDHQDDDDNWWVWCSPIVPNGGLHVDDLGQVAHTLPGNCKSVHVHNDNWNDCISSVVVFLPSSLWVVCFYQEANEGGQAAHYSGPRSWSRIDLPYSLPTGGFIGDEVSSIRLDNDGSC